MTDEIDKETMYPTQNYGVVDWDPTYGRIDRDIQWLVDNMKPSSISERVVLENNLQNRRTRYGHL